MDKDSRMNAEKKFEVDVAPSATAYVGAAAIERLATCLNCASQDDATGAVWLLRSSAGPWERVIEVNSILDASTEGEVVIIDSGNIHGDSWKYTYFPKSNVGLFIEEGR